MTTPVSAVRRAGLFTLHQLTVLTGILLFPVTLVASRVGFTIPVGRAVSRVGAAYSAAAGSAEASDTADEREATTEAEAVSPEAR